MCAVSEIKTDQVLQGKPCTFAEVLTAAPHALRMRATIVAGQAKPDESSWGDFPGFPRITLHCPSCNSEQNFEGAWVDSVNRSLSAVAVAASARAVRRERPAQQSGTVDYTCNNCRAHVVQIALRASVEQPGVGGTLWVWKIGQDPAFNVQISKRVQRLMQGNDWKLYTKGRAAEQQGMGLAALAYYRRAVENTKSALLDRMIKVAQDQGENNLVAGLQSAKKDWQFSASIEKMAVVPARLLIAGQNPLAVLHSAFSDGVHNRTDEECLEAARAGRVVLERLLQLIGEVLTDKSHVEEALRSLMSRPRS